MRKYLAANSVGKVPDVTGMNFLYAKPPDQLAAHRFNQTSNAFANAKLCRFKLGRLSILGRHGKLKSLFRKQLLLKRLGKISPITQQKTSVAFYKFFDHFDVVGVGRSKLKGLNHSNRVNLQMKSQAIEGLRAKLLAVGGQPPEYSAATGSGESTNRHRNAVDDDNVVSKASRYVLKKSVFDFPEVRCLSQERFTAGELREEMAVKSFEETEDGLIGIKAEKFADNFHRKCFAIRQLRLWASGSESPVREKFFHKIISFAEDIYDKIVKVHFYALGGQWNRFCFCLLIPSTRGHFLYQC